MRLHQQVQEIGGISRPVILKRVGCNTCYNGVVIITPYTFTLAEAADILSVSTEQVRRYVYQGILPAMKRAGVWFVSGIHVKAVLLGRKPTGGRPLSHARVWKDIFAGKFDRLELVHDLDPYTCRNRSTITRWNGTTEVVQEMLGHPNIVIGGIHAGELYGASLPPLPNEAQIYLSHTTASEESNDHPCSALTLDPLGEVVTHVVSDDIWAKLVQVSVHSDQVAASYWIGQEGLYAPISLTVLDLLESPHTRERSAVHDLCVARS